MGLEQPSIILSVGHAPELLSKQAVLTSWKEIAQYVGKGVRTVQRWEQEFGFPIRRPAHSSHKAILALPEEIDAWVRDTNVFAEHCELERLRLEVERLRTELARRDQVSPADNVVVAA